MTTETEAPPVATEDEPRAADGAGVPVGPARGLPLTPEQEALWYLERLAPVGGAYTIAVAARIHGTLDPAAMVAAVHGLVERHAALRVRVEETPDGLRQRIAAVPRADAAVVDLAEAGPEAAARRIAADAHRRFDLARGPLVRLRLYRRAGASGEPPRWDLLLAIHHLVADLGSFEVLARELGVLYLRARGAATEPLPAPPSYEEWIAGRLERLAGPEGRELADWWRDRLPAAPPPLELPADRQRPAAQSFRGRSVRRPVPAPTVAALRRLAKSHRATLSTLVLAAFETLLHRLAGQDELAVGVPTAGRKERAARGLVGYLVNPVVVASGDDGRTPFGEHLGRTHRALAEAVAHRDHPFPLLARRLCPERDPSRAPVFQAMFVFQSAREAALAGFALDDVETRLPLGDLELEPTPLAEERAQLDLQLTAAEVAPVRTAEGRRGRRMALELKVDAALFDPTTAARWLGSLETLLVAAAEAPDTPLGALPLLGAAERAAVVREWALGPALPALPAVAEGTGALGAFAARAAAHPERVAVLDAGGGVAVTYGELARRVARTARALREAGVGPEVRVAVRLERGPALVETLLAVHAAGGAYVPVDPKLPPARRRLVIEESGARLLVAEGPEEGVDLPLVRPDAGDAGGDTAPAEAAARLAAAAAATHPESLAYLIFTSGSTGRPKGVAIVHRGVGALVAWAVERFGGALERVLLATSVGFDLFAFELFAPLAAGGTVVVARSVLDLASTPERDRLTLVNTVPSAFAEVLGMAAPPAALRAVNLAGEPLTDALAAEIGRRLPEATLANLYGPSETTTYSTGAAHRAGESARRGAPAIGRPLAGERARVVGPRLEPLPAGVVGELVLGGRGVARGYAGRPAATAAAFVPDPFAATAEEAGGRIYRTGDLTRWTATGELEFLGRRDHQVKVRGFRIELGEVEAALAEHPRVAQAVVLVAPGGDALHAYLVLDRPAAGDGGAALAEELAADLAGRLPAAMVPSAFVSIDELPRTASGKIDRRALAARAPAPAERPSAEVPGGGGRAPRTAAERAVAELFREVLGLPEDAPLGVADDLFRLGGHSLTAARLVGRLRETAGIELPLQRLLAQPTVAGIAGALGAALGADAGPIPAGRADPVSPPLSFAQERLWFLERLDPGSPRYNMAAALDLAGALDPAALARAVAALVRRHAPLRAVLGERAGEPTQVVLVAPPVPLPVVDLSRLAPPEAAAERDRLAAAEARRPFDLAAGLPCRFLLVRTAEGAHRLVLAVHHVAADGWSLRRVVPEDLSALYRAARGTREPAALARTLPPPPVAYGDYAAWQRERLDEERAGALLEHWRRRLDGLTPLDLPADRPRGRGRGHRGIARPVVLPRALADRLADLARERGATFFLVLLAAYQALLARLSGRADLAVGAPHANRDRAELEGLVGLFVNTLALRTEVAAAEPFEAHLARVREAAHDAFAHAELPFERLVEALAPARDLSRPPLVEAFLAYDATPATPPRFAGVEATIVDLSSGTAKFDLSLILEERPEGVVGALVHDADRFDRTTGERWARHLETLLAAVAANPGRPLAELPLLAPAERFQLAVEWPAEPAAPADAPFVPVHEAIVAHAYRRMGAPAVLAPGGEVPFGELVRRAGRLLTRLEAAGVRAAAEAGRAPIVALFLEPGTDLAAAILATLSAGAAYLPLDPRDPVERHAFVLADSRPRAVIAPAAAPLPALPEGTERVTLEAAWEAPLAPRLPAVATRPGDPAYVLYTSGSTGRPKGVAIEHGSLARYLEWARRELLAAPGGTGGADGEAGDLLLVPMTSRPSFDASLKQLLTPLAAGLPVWVPAAGLDRPADLLAELAYPPGRRPPGTAVRVAVNCVPSAWRAMLEAIESGEATAPDNLARVLLGGEALDPLLVERTARRLPRVEVWNLYGPTEATANAAAGRVTAGGARRGATPLGRPAAGARLHLLDASLRPAPLGAPAELCLGGTGLARGYLGRPAATAAAFVPDPFSRRPGARLYRTGDLARRLPDGGVVYLGRRDLQVKVRGHRIEPGEIEAALAECQGVTGAAVAVRPAPGTGEPRLVAWVEPDTAEPKALRAALAARLPRWMVPAAIVPLAALPRFPTGKLDRARLPGLPSTPAEAAPAEAAPTAVPADPIEELVARVWADVLALPRPPGRDDDFFALGGHSLVAARVIGRLGDALGTELPVRALFESPSVAGLADFVRATRGAPALPPIEPVADEAPAAASYGQHRLWFLDRLVPGSPLYNIPAAARLAGPLDAPALARALGEVARRHETLRLAFAERDGAPVQAVAPADDPRSAPRLATVDLSGLPPGRAAAESARLAAAEARVPFDLARAPLSRALLVRRSAGDHDLLLTLHHAIADGWSIGVLLDELAAFYRPAGGAAPRPARRPAAPPVRYRDFAAWQRAWLEAGALESQLAFWRDALAGVAPLELSPRPRPAGAGTGAGSGSGGADRGGEIAVVLPAAAAEGCRRLARETGATPFMVLLAAFAGLLARLSGQDGFAVSTPVANRRRPELERLIGLFVNTLALRVDLAGDPSFRRLLRRTRRHTLAAFDHQDLPFERLVEALEPERGPAAGARPPIAQAMLVVHNAPRPAPALAGLEVAPLGRHSGTAKLDLTLALHDEPAGFAGTLEYAAALFDPTFARRLVGSFAVLLEAAAAEPERRLGELPLLAPAERHQLLAEWSGAAPAARPAGPGATLAERVGAAARRRPDAVAIATGRERLTYGHLAARAGRIARGLAALGVGPETTVGVALERSPSLVVALLAVLEAGGAYVPLDPGYPADRVAYMLADSGCRLVIGDALPGSAAGDADGPRRVRLAELEALGAGAAGRAPAAAAADNLAYLIYTSGSTGRPKGVAISHASAVAFLDWAAEAFRPAEMAGVVAATSVCFDLSVFELFGTLAGGGTVLLAGSALDLPELPTADRATLVNTVPSVLAEVLRHGPLPPAVAAVGLAGEPLPRDLVRRIEAGRPSAPPRVLNLYGPSESTTYATWAEVGESAGRAAAAGEPPIGRPVTATRGYVVDGALRPLPAGVVGELVLAGAGLARGYLARPAATAERFVPDPFAGRAGGGPPGGRVYRTGDRVVQGAAGELHYLGRGDGQVKVRGFRIELGEVEAALLDHPAIEQAAVVATGRPGEADRQLVAFVVGAAGGGDGAGARALRRHLEARLPAYMVPSTVRRVDALPHTPSGKIDRRALVALDRRASLPEVGPAAAHQPPRDPLEATVAAVWAELLGAERVGIHQDFFSLGGHSLAAARLAARLRATCGVDLPLAELFRHTTVAGQAAAIRGARSGAAGAGRPVRAIPPAPLDPERRRRGVPLAPGQSRLAFLHRLQGGSASYNLPLALWVDGPLDPAALAGALTDVVERHEAFRTRIVADPEGGADLQQAAPPWPVVPPTVDLSGLPPAGAADAAEAAGRRWAARPFDLGSGRLLAPLLVRTAPARHLLVLGQHHVVTDGWSQGVLVRDLARCYERRLFGVAGDPGPPPLQQGDVAVWQLERLAAGDLDAALDHWRERLAGVEPLGLPTDRPRPPVRTERGAGAGFRLDPEATAALKAVGRERGATLFMLLLAGFQALLGRWSGRDDVAVGTPVAHRDGEGLEDAVAFLVDTLVVRTRTGGPASFADLLARVREATLDAFAHQEVPFERVVEAVRPDRDLARTPLFEAFFALQDTPLPSPELGAARLALAPVSTGTTKFDLTLSARPEAGALVGSLEVSRDLFDPTTAARFAGQLARLLAAAARAPEAPLDHLSPLSAAERHQLLVELGRPARETPADPPTLYERFRDWSRRRPDALAVTEGGRSISYGDLARRARRLAVSVAAAGAGPEDVVAVLAGRTLELVVGVLAVQAAGAVYLPLDPRHPAERLAATLEDARARLVLAAPEGAAAAAALPAGAPPVVPVAVAPPAPDGRAAPELDRPAAPEQLSYVIFTSGSTGRPKGAGVEHRSLARLFPATEDWLEPSPEDAWTQFHSPAFDFSVWELWGALAHGARLVMVPPEVARVPDGTLDLVERERVTVFGQTPSAFALLSEARSRRAAPALEAMRLVVMGGEAQTEAAVAPWIARQGAERPALYNVYGLTETTVSATCRRLVGRQPCEPTASLLGRQIGDVELYVLDGDGRPAPLGVVGEIAIAGRALARGYLGRPALSAERWVPHPWSATPGARLYRTGDLARWRAWGELEYLGRRDHQVQVRGHRVELGEIEAALLRRPEVRQAAVVARRVGGTDALVGYVATGGGAADAAELRRSLAADLPAYMIPERLVFLDTLPLTTSGKVDRRALPEPAAATARAGGGYREPRSELESTIAAVWQRVLGLDRVGIYDNFFDLGGHSLLLARAHRELCAALGREVPMVDLFQHTSVATLAAHLAAAPAGGETAAGGAGAPGAPEAPSARGAEAAARRTERARDRRDRTRRRRELRRDARTPGEPSPPAGRAAPPRKEDA